MGSWNNRIMVLNGKYRIAEVWYDSDGTAVSWSDSEICTEWDSLDELRIDMRLMYQALDRPVVDMADMEEVIGEPPQV
jgi:hypothetical protein